MEHLTRNTNNDRIVYTIENLKKENQNILSKELKDLVDKTINVCTAILSSLISGGMLSILKQESKISFGIIGTIVCFLIIFFAMWYVSARFLLPFFYKLLCREKPDITKEEINVTVRRFNTEIMQKVSEIDEIIEVIKETDIIECKRLNFILSLYKLQEIVNFMYNEFVVNKVAMRTTIRDGSTETFRYYFNVYTVSAVFNTMVHIRDEMNSLLDDESLKGLAGYDLLKKDLDNISKKMDKININF